MKSPFPGMDPFLERCWRDVHASLVLYTRSQLRRQLGAGLKARVEERVVLETSSAQDERGIYPDVRIVSWPTVSAVPPHATAAGAVAEPLVIERLEERHTEGYVQVLDATDGNRVVTVIEILSPTNKRLGKGRDEFRRKQAELAEAGVNLVEIDLLRTGTRTLQLSEYDIPALARTDYAACVERGHRTGRFEFYAMPLRQRLSAIAIPLRPSDPDVRLDIQELVDLAYEDGSYDEGDYRHDPVPPFNDDDAAWILERLTSAGLR